MFKDEVIEAVEGAIDANRRGGPREPVIGAPMPHAVVVNEPVNEAGVLVLFGALAAELGFEVVAMRAGFPDAELVRVTDGQRERLRVEFEFESKNFALHRHDASACDLIVCWRHNWPACPLPVLELSREVRAC